MTEESDRNLLVGVLRWPWQAVLWLAGLFIHLRAFLRTGFGPLSRYYIPIDLKFAFAIALVIGGSMGALGYTIVRNQRDLIHGQIRSMGSAAAGQLAEVAREPLLADDDLRLDILVRGIIAEEGVLGAAVLDRTGAPLAVQGELPEPSVILAPMTAAADSVDDDAAPGSATPATGVLDWYRIGAEAGEPDAVTFLRTIQFESTPLGYAMVTFDRAELNAALVRSRGAIYSATAVMILFGLVLSVVVGRRLSRPIHELVEASKAVDGGDLQYRMQQRRRRDEIGHLMSSFNTMAEGLLQKNHVEEVFNRYMPRQVAHKLLSDLQEVQLGGSRVQGTVMFADAASFTAVSEDMEPDDVAELLNDYFSHIARVAAFFQGSVDKYIGDEAMLVFGVPNPDPDHCFHAVAASVLYQRVVARVSERRKAAGKTVLQFKIGVNTGVMLAGNMGSSDHMQYTVVGDSVNLASRLCGMAEPGQIVVSHDVQTKPGVRDWVVARRHRSMRLRGKKLPVMTYLVTDVTLSHRATMNAYLEELFGEDREGDDDG